MVERKVRILMEKNGWIVIRAGSSLGEADLICIKSGKCVLLQVKSTKKKTFHYYGYQKRSLEGFPFYLVVDFGYGKLRALFPQQRVTQDDGENWEEFVGKI